MSRSDRLFTIIMMKCIIYFVKSKNVACSIFSSLACKHCKGDVLILVNGMKKGFLKPSQLQIHFKVPMISEYFDPNR